MKGVVVAGAFLVASSFSVLASAESYGIVTGTCVNIRQQPGTSSPIIGQAYYGEQITVYENNDGWVRMSYNGVEGWMSGTYINIQEEAKLGIVTGSCVNIRQEASTSSSIIGQAYQGERLAVLEVKDGWVKIDYNGSEAWMYGQYVDVREELVSRSSQNVNRGLASRIVEYSKQFLGKPYVYGGNGPNGFDCSGFTRYIFNHFGISINRVAADQTAHGIKISKGELQPGDLVFFDTTGPVNGQITHVGIYIGGGQFIHASSGRSNVRIDTLNSGYYANTYITARRIIN